MYFKWGFPGEYTLPISNWSFLANRHILKIQRVGQQQKSLTSSTQKQNSTNTKNIKTKIGQRLRKKIIFDCILQHSGHAFHYNKRE